MELDPDYQLVVSIEIGTSSSGIAYTDRLSMRHSADIYSPVFKSVDGHTVKPSTCVLFEPNGHFHSFGDEAEAQIEYLTKKQEHEGWSFFRNFKSKLDDSKVLDEDFTLEAESGCEMSAKKVVSAIINYLKTKLIESAGSRLMEFNIRWVILVPSFWKQSAKSFMKQCAIEAGIEREKILIALEPEAAALHAKSRLSEYENKDLENAKKYMVCDIGGGSIDITICEVLKDGNIREVFLSSQEFKGTEIVRAGFNNLLERILGKEDFKAYKESYHLDLLDVYRSVERYATKYTPESEGNIHLLLPFPLLSMLQDSLDCRPEFEGEVTIKRDKMKVKQNVIFSSLQNALSEIRKYIERIFLHPEGNGVCAILLVGGFSEIQLLEEIVRKEFPDKIVVIPPQPRLAALKGAVMYGFSPKIIQERRASFTVGCTHYYRQNNHQEGKTAIIDKVKFQKLIEIGTLISVDTQQSIFHYESDKDDNSVSFFFYATTDYSVTEVPNENCFFIGSAALHFNVPKDIPKNISLSVTFTGTVMEVTVSCLQSNATATVYLNCGYKLDTDEYEHVAAIDFGTTYSGFAYLSKHDYKYSAGKPEITTKTWNAGNFQSLKTSTCILFNSDGKFDSFGFEAENKFSELVLDGEQEGWYLFRRFKMMLYAEMRMFAVLKSNIGLKRKGTQK